MPYLESVDHVGVLGSYFWLLKEEHQCPFCFVCHNMKSEFAIIAAKAAVHKKYY